MKGLVVVPLVCRWFGVGAVMGPQMSRWDSGGSFSKFLNPNFHGPLGHREERLGYGEGRPGYREERPGYREERPCYRELYGTPESCKISH